MGRLDGGQGAASGNSGGGRISADGVAQIQQQYTQAYNRKKRLDDINASAQGKGSLSHSDALKLMVAAYKDGDLSQDDYTKLAKNNWAQREAQVQADAKTSFEKGTGGTGVLGTLNRFAAGIGGLVHDNVSFQKDDNNQDTIGTKGSLVRSVLGDPATAIMTQVEVTRAQQNQEMAHQALKSAKDAWGKQLSRGEITQKQYDDGIKKVQANVDKADQIASHNVSVSSRRDPTKDAASIASIPLNAATGGVTRDLAVTGLTAGLKQFGGRIAGDALVGAATGADSRVQADGKNVKASDIIHDSLVGGGLGAAVPVAGRLRGGGAVDRAVGEKIANVGERISTHDGVITKLNELRNDGLIGSIDKKVSDTGKKVAYAASDAIRSTKVGAKLGEMADNFNSRFISNMHNVYKLARRSDFEGKTDGGEAAISSAVNDAYRSQSFAKSIIDNDSGIKKYNEAVASKGDDIQAAIDDTDRYIAARQEKELLDSGKKAYSGKTRQKVEQEWKDVQGGPHEAANKQAYEGLVEAYSNKLERDHKNGFIEDDDYKAFKEDPHDYIRVQRELNDAELAKPGPKGAGQKMSVGSTDIVQKRNKYASGDQMSPIQTYIQATQHATKKHYENVAAKTIHQVLEKGGRGGVKLIRSSDAVLERRGLLRDAHAEKVNADKLERSLKGHKKDYATLAKEVTKLKAEGRTRMAQELNKALKAIRKAGDAAPETPMNPREVMDTLSSLDHKDFRKIRKMIESRNSKMGDILDTIESVNRDLNDTYARKEGLISDLRGLHVNPDIKHIEHFEFMEKGIKNIVKTDPAVGAAIKGYNKEISNVVVRWLRFPTTIFKMGTTTWNVAFAAVNLPKDIAESAINSQKIFSTHLNPLNHFTTLAALAGRPIGPEEAKMFAKFMEANKGGRMIDIYRTPRDARFEALNLVKGDAKKLSKAFTYIKHPVTAGRQFMDFADEMIGKTEDYTRYLNWRGTYLNAVKNGRNVPEALKIADKASRENSINFLEHGDVGQVMNAFLPYFNAAVQSGRQLARKFRDQPISTITKTSVLIATPVAVSTYWNTSDPKRKAVYATIPEYIKESNFVVVTPQAKWDANKKKWDGVTLIPKPLGYGSLAEPMRKFIEWQGENSPEDHMNIKKFLLDDGASVAGDFVNSFSPIDFSSPDKFLSSVTPQILKPTAESILNKDFYSGEDIVKGTLQDQPAEDQKYANYSKLTTFIGGMLNTSPLKIDHWIKATFGEVGTQGQHYIDKFALGGKDNQTADDGSKFSDVGGRSLVDSLTRRFGNVPGQEDKNDFYSTYNPVVAKQNRANTQITALIGQGKTQEAKRRAQEFNDSIEGYFKTFKDKYGNSPTYDDQWDDMINKLKISTTDRSIKQRLRNYQKKNE